MPKLKKGISESSSPVLKDLTCCEKHLQEDNLLARSVGAHSFLRVKLVENCSLLGTGNIKTFFRAKWRLPFICVMFSSCEVNTGTNCSHVNSKSLTFPTVKKNYLMYLSSEKLEGHV